MTITRTQTRALAALLAGTGITFAVPALAAQKAPAHAASPADPLKGLNVDIPSSTFKLSNGLTVVVHEDHSAPLVAVNVWYHVGSKNEPRGRSGFAHLFEHLMFNGSENFNDDFFKATQKIGATDQNGTTNSDRTNYFQTVPKAALDSILWLESDRMGHLLGAIDQGKLDEQRKVVKNERRQNYENRPYAKAWGLIARATVPEGHPYHHLTIGSMEDLSAASLDDVKDWFKTYYGPSNAVLVLSGDITPEEARAKTQTYFGDIAPGTPVSQPESWVVPMKGTVRETAYDRVAQARIYRVWNIPGAASADTDYLQFLARVLGGDKNSRLYKRLVIDEKLATDADADIDNREIGGQFMISADVKAGADPDRIERIIDEELKALLQKGPTAAELARVRTSTLASYVRSLESISTKAGILAEAQTYLGDASAWKLGFERFRDATSAQLQGAGSRWLTQGDYVLRVLPFGKLSASAGGADRTAMPMPGTAVPATFPSVERGTLGNGLKLVVVPRPGVPVVNLTMVMDSGVPADWANIPAGTGSLALSLLDEGTTSRTREQLTERLARLGATLGTNGGGEQSYVSLSALKPALRESLGLYADVIMNPAFAPAEVERVKAQSLAALAQSKEDASRVAGRLLPAAVYGPDGPRSQLVTEASIEAIDRATLGAFHRRWFHPNNATLIVAGDTSLAEVRPLLEAAFAGWRPAEVPQVLEPISQPPAQPIVYLVDKPGAAQSVIQAAFLAPPRKDGDEVSRDAFNTAFGGSFTSRLNMKLREEKGWAYGARSRVAGGRGSRMFSAGASVQADKTAESMQEIAALLKGVTGERQIDQAELLAAKNSMSLGLSSEWSTSDGIAQYVADQVVNNLPDDYYAGYPAKIAATTLDAARSAGTSLIANRPITWVVVGDRSKIEAAIRALNLGEVRPVDADGKPAR